MKDFFLSFSSADLDPARKLKKIIEGSGRSCFLAEKNQLPVGKDFSEEIRKELLNSKRVLVLISPKSLESEWVITEWGAAWVLGKPIIPVLYRTEPENLPDRLKRLQAVDLHDINDDLLKKFDDIVGEINKVKLDINRGLGHPCHFIFDIDGTVLGPQDSITDTIGEQFIKYMRYLKEKDCTFTFITGNDYHLQRSRLMIPIRSRGLTVSTFWFCDGGSRAFEFINDPEPVEIKDYSTGNIIEESDVDELKKITNELLHNFLSLPEKAKLLMPKIEWSDKTLYYLDILIFPLKPSFRENKGIQKLKLMISNLEGFKNEFEFLESYKQGLIIRAHGSDPDKVVSNLQVDIAKEMATNPELKDLARPEIKLRGGLVTTQFTIKPFSTNIMRKEFYNLFLAELKNKGIDSKFEAQIAGRVSIDVQVKGVDKEKALRFFYKRKNISPDHVAYIGDEFTQFGNDRCIAAMDPNYRPKTIINVGNILDDQDELKSNIIECGNGPIGTLNILRFVCNHI